MKNWNYDAVVVGGGLAGLVAAIEAAKRGLGVLLVCKSRAGKSGNTLVSGAALSVLNTGAKSGDSPALLERDILASGCGMNDPRLCRTFAKESASAVDMLKEYGVAFKEAGGIPMVKQPPGHSVPRMFPSEFREYPYMNRGLALTLPLVERAEELGVVIRNDTRLSGSSPVKIPSADFWHGTAAREKRFTSGPEQSFWPQAGEQGFFP